MSKFLGVFITGACMHIAGWADWLWFSWLNRFADMNHTDKFHWAAMPHGFSAAFLLILGCVVMGIALEHRKEWS